MPLGTAHCHIGKEFSIKKVSFYCRIAASLVTLGRHFYR